MNDSQWNYLGLSHNPFSDPQKEFFPGAEREALLSKIRKIDEWSRPVLAVTGQHGVGKTCLFRALSSSLEGGVAAARVNGSLVSRAGDVLSALVQGYGVAAPAGADAPLLIELVKTHLKDQVQRDRTSLVLVDDAHLLEQRAVDDLVSLAGSGARLAFFSEPQFVESLQRALERNAETSGDDELGWHEMLLSPFSRDQTADYLAWRFDEAGYSGRVPFTEHQMDGIHSTSDGYPGRLDFAANEQLMAMTSGGVRPSGIPSKHLWLAGAIAGVLAVVFWFWSPGDEGSSVDSREVAVALPDATPAAEEPIAEEPADEPKLAPQSRTVAPVTNRPAPEPVVSQSRTVRPTVVKEPVLEQRVQQRVEQTVEAVSDPEPVPEPVVQAKPRPEPVPEAPAVVRSSVPTSEPVLPKRDSVQSASWLLSQSDAAYTIQLIGFSESERANAYLAEQQRPADFALFRTRSGDRVVHVVTHGIYDSQAEAESAVASLPTTIGKVTPWIRSVRGVKNSIRTALQVDG